MFTVTLKELRRAGACYSGYNKVVCNLKEIEYTPKDRYMSFAHTGDISLIEIIKTNGLIDAIWALNILKDKQYDISLYSLWCVRQLQHLMTTSDASNLNDIEKHIKHKVDSDVRIRALNETINHELALQKKISRVVYTLACDESTINLLIGDLISVLREMNSEESEVIKANMTDMYIKMCNNNAPWQQNSQG